MTEFTRKECLRLIDKLTETDPTTEAYHILLSSIERFDSIGNTVDEIAQLREGAGQQVVIDVAALKEQIKREADTSKVVPFEAPSFPEEVKDDLVKDDSATDHTAPAEETKEEKTYEPSDVRSALCEARSKGVNVSAILQKFGVSNFQNLPAKDYGALIEALKAV